MEFPHTLAAGGIVVRHDSVPRIAVVRLRKDKDWVLPKGKLNRNETALAAARREVLEETGHQCSVHEFVGALTYPVRGKPKVVQFWRMQATGAPSRKLMSDVSAVEFLPLNDAVARLSRPYEQLFLETVGPAVLRTIARKARKRAAKLRMREAESKAPPPKSRRVRRKTPSPARRPVIFEMTEEAGTGTIETGPEAERRAVKRPWLQRYVLDRLRNRELRS
jgi:8-oxo-dGTP diphosphatase